MYVIMSYKEYIKLSESLSVYLNLLNGQYGPKTPYEYKLYVLNVYQQILNDYDRQYVTRVFTDFLSKVPSNYIELIDTFKNFLDKIRN